MHAEGRKAGGSVPWERGYPEMMGWRKILNGLSNSGMKPLMDGCRIPFINKSGGDGPGLGCREDGTVVARAYVPEFATSQVVPSYDRYLSAIYRNSTTLILPLEVWMLSGCNRPSRTIPSELSCGGNKK